MVEPNCEINIDQVKTSYACVAQMNEPLGAVLRLILPDPEGKEYALLTIFDPDTGTARVRGVLHDGVAKAGEGVCVFNTGNVWCGFSYMEQDIEIKIYYRRQP